MSRFRQATSILLFNIIKTFLVYPIKRVLFFMIYLVQCNSLKI